MAKNETWITTWYPRDEKVFRAFSNCGVLQTKDLHEYVKDKRIKCYQKDGYIESKTDTKTGESYYKLTDKGRDWCRDKYDTDPCTAKSWNHNSGVRDMYFALPVEERMNQMSENDLQKASQEFIDGLKTSSDPNDRELGFKLDYDYHNGKMSTPDFGVLKFEGNTITEASFQECVTKNYKEYEIEAKFQYASAFSGSLEMKYV